jgi:hypothetical protein
MNILTFLNLVCLIANLCVGITGVLVLKHAKKLNKEFEKILKDIK